MRASEYFGVIEIHSNVRVPIMCVSPKIESQLLFAN